MSSQQWWVRTDSTVLGPMPSAHLRDLVRSGVIGRETLVSFDNEALVRRPEHKKPLQGRSTPGRRDGPRAREPVKVFRPGPADRNSPGDSGADRDGVRFPVIRMRQGFFRAQIVAIYEDHLLKGSRFLRPLRLTEQMCHPSGKSELERQLHVSRSVELGDGSEVRETANLNDPGTVKTFLRGGTKRSCHFEVRESAGKQVRFTVRSTEANGVHAALYRVLSDRYFIRPEKTGGCGAYAIMFFWCLLGLIGLPIVVFFLMSLIYRGPGSEIFAFVVWLLSFALMIWGGLHFLFAHRGPWSKATELPKLASREKPVARNQVARASRPLHSPVLGWSLKFLGLAYWIAIASPLTDGLNEYVDQALKEQLVPEELDLDIDLGTVTIDDLCRVSDVPAAIRPQAVGRHPEADPFPATVRGRCGYVSPAAWHVVCDHGHPRPLVPQR